MNNNKGIAYYSAVEHYGEVMSWFGLYSRIAEGKMQHILRSFWRLNATLKNRVTF